MKETVCPHCKLEYNGSYDPCLGKLPGVIAACCGHGGKGTHQSYITFENKVTIYGFNNVQHYNPGKPLTRFDLKES